MQLELAIDNPKTTLAAKAQGYFYLFISYLTLLKGYNGVVVNFYFI
jgi:hypothetical protein